MSFGGGKKGLLAAAAVVGLAFTPSVMADDYTPTLGPDSAYSVSEGTSTDYNFAVNDGTNVKYYKMNIKDKSSYNVDLSTTNNGGTALEMSPPGNQNLKLYYKYQKPENYTLKQNGNMTQYSALTNPKISITDTTHKNYYHYQSVLDDASSPFRTGVLENYSGKVANTKYDSKLGDIISDFVSNAVQTDVTIDKSFTGGSMGGAITNYTNEGGDASIDKISGAFVDNNIDTVGPYSYGGAISSYATSANAKIGSIEGNFTGNYIEGENNTIGGAIANVAFCGNVEIGEVKGDFTGNYILASQTAYEGENEYFGLYYNGGTYVIGSHRAYGGAIGNYGEVGQAKINSITGNFILNGVYNSGDYAIGGAIANLSTTDLVQGYAEIGSISGDFIDNALGNDVVALGTELGSIFGFGYGGAIGNCAFEGGAKIGSIKGDFIGNHVFGSRKNNEGSLGGGAIGKCGTSRN